MRTTGHILIVLSFMIGVAVYWAMCLSCDNSVCNPGTHAELMTRSLTDYQCACTPDIIKPGPM